MKVLLPGMSEDINRDFILYKMADDASFGLEFYKLGKLENHTIDLLNSGVKLCTLILKGAELYSKGISSDEEYESWYAFSKVKACDKNILDIKTELEQIIQNVRDKKPLQSKENFASLQRYFFDFSAYYFSGVVQRIKEEEDAATLRLPEQSSLA